ncbi:MAG TPA: hypothetical protein PLV41_07700 [Miltoncostaeales bacterium]|nr:hypothetical protein [Miltoncostaeales bacterium]
MNATTGTSPIESLKRAARWVCAVVFAAIIGGAFWMAIIEEGHGGHILGTTWTSHDFPDGLGNALGASAEPARKALWGTLVIAIGVVLLFAAMERLLPGKEWRKGLSFAPIPFLLWGLVFCPLVDAKQTQDPIDGRFIYSPSGLFGTESSLTTMLSAAVAALGASLAIARIYQLVRSAEWWEPASLDAEFIIDHDVGPLLELPEQGTEQSGKGTGGQTDPLRWT